MGLLLATPTQSKLRRSFWIPSTHNHLCSHSTSTDHRNIPPNSKGNNSLTGSSNSTSFSHLTLRRQEPSGGESCLHTSPSATRHKNLPLALYPGAPLSAPTSARVFCKASAGLPPVEGCWPHTAAPEPPAAGRGIPAGLGEEAKHLPGCLGQESACQETKAMSKLVQPVAASAEGQLGTGGV